MSSKKVPWALCVSVGCVSVGCFLLGCGGTRGGTRTAPDSRAECQGFGEASESSVASVRQASTQCAVETLRSGVAIRGTVDVAVGIHPNGEPRLRSLDVAPHARKASFGACLQRVLTPSLFSTADRCTLVEESLAFESQLELPVQARTGLEYDGSGVAQVARGPGQGSLAVGVQTTGQLTAPEVRRSLSTDFHRVLEECFLVAAEVALSGGPSFDPDVTTVIESVWFASGQTRERIVRSPSTRLTACLDRNLPGTLQPRPPLPVGVAHIEIPLRRYLHADVVEALRR